ncbi:MAG: HypC/HybG/HupF family hydrogenase formation chaperone [Coriobacteriia bacterium]|nr:HypC/HybG/HupF family hydrogenase formation chaperone [Coriobacteriia bacterium]
MCLAIPALVREKSGVNLATVDILGVTRKVSLDLVTDVEVGDWVLVHAGFAIEKVDEQFANETLELLKSLPFFEEDATLMGDSPTEFTGHMYSDADTATSGANATTPAQVVS